MRDEFDRKVEKFEKRENTEDFDPLIALYSNVEKWTEKPSDSGIFFSNNFLTFLKFFFSKFD